MPPGRNDPCPCGSGRKYKKCCLNKQARPETPGGKLSNFDLVSITAYAGRIGRQREAWCKEFFVWRGKVGTMMESHLKQMADEKAKNISCSKGCWYCCTQFIGASLQECEAIVYWLYQHLDSFSVFIRQYPEWRKRVRKNEVLFQKINSLGNMQFPDLDNQELRKAFLETTGEFAKLDIPCPFLAGGECIIYPVRPLACVSQVSVSPPEYCKQAVADIPFLLIVTGTPQIPYYFYGLSHNLTYAPAALLVYEILQNCFSYLDSVPGMAGIEMEAFTDPEIETILRNNVARLK